MMQIQFQETTTAAIALVDWHMIIEEMNIKGYTILPKLLIQHMHIAGKYLRGLVKNHKISFGGNRNLKIFGTLKCASVKRMKRKNRVFFTSELEANSNGFRPCGHCMNAAYKRWKNNGLI